MVYNPGLIQSSVFSLWLDFFITAPFQSFDDWCKLSIENCFVAKQFENHNWGIDLRKGMVMVQDK